MHCVEWRYKAPDGLTKEKSDALFANDVSTMSVTQLMQVFADAPSLDVPLQPDGWRVQALLADAGMASSIGDATRLIKGRGIKVNGRVFDDPNRRLGLTDAIEGKLFILAKGKKDKCLVRVKYP